jgi:hypothetical protein
VEKVRSIVRRNHGEHEADIGMHESYRSCLLVHACILFYQDARLGVPSRISPLPHELSSIRILDVDGVLICRGVSFWDGSECR